MYGWAAAVAVMSGQAYGRQRQAPSLLSAARGGWWPQHEPGHALAPQDRPLTDMSSACGKEPSVLVVSAPHGHGHDSTSSPRPPSSAPRWNLRTGDSMKPATTAAGGTGFEEPHCCLFGQTSGLLLGRDKTPHESHDAVVPHQQAVAVAFSPIHELTSIPKPIHYNCIG